MKNFYDVRSKVVHGAWRPVRVRTRRPASTYTSALAGEGLHQPDRFRQGVADRT